MRQAELRREQIAAAYDKLYSTAERTNKTFDVVMDLAGKMRGTIGGTFGPLVGSLLDLFVALRDLRSPAKGAVREELDYRPETTPAFTRMDSFQPRESGVMPQGGTASEGGEGVSQSAAVMQEANDALLAVGHTQAEATRMLEQVLTAATETFKTVQDVLEAAYKRPATPAAESVPIVPAPGVSIIHKTTGGIVPEVPGIPRAADEVPIRATAGEGVLTVKAMQTPGVREFMEDANSGRAGYATGGVIASAASMLGGASEWLEDKVLGTGPKKEKREKQNRLNFRHAVRDTFGKDAHFDDNSAVIYTRGQTIDLTLDADSGNVITAFFDAIRSPEQSDKHSVESWDRAAKTLQPGSIDFAHKLRDFTQNAGLLGLGISYTSSKKRDDIYSRMLKRQGFVPEHGGFLDKLMGIEGHATWKPDMVKVDDSSHKAAGGPVLSSLAGHYADGGEVTKHYGDGGITDKFGQQYYVEHRRFLEREGKEDVPHQYEVFDADYDAPIRHHVGSAMLNRHESSVGDVQINKDFQRKGIASALYDYIGNTIGEPLRRSESQTDEGKAFWEARLKQQGEHKADGGEVAEVAQPPSLWQRLKSAPASAKDWMADRYGAKTLAAAGVASQAVSYGASALGAATGVWPYGTWGMGPALTLPIAEGMYRMKGAERIKKEKAEHAAMMEMEGKRYAGLPKFEESGAGRYAKGGEISKEQRAENFGKWFGDSKVVDEEGKPQRFFHGTGARQDFDEFYTDPAMSSREIGSHFGPPEQADSFARGRERGRVYPVHLSIQNPLRLSDPEMWDADTLLPQLKAKGIDVSGLNRKSSNSAVREAIEKAGYDGIVYVNAAEGLPSSEARKRIAQERTSRKTEILPDELLRELGAKDAYIAFHPTQIKSASANEGTYDPVDPRIHKAIGGPIPHYATGTTTVPGSPGSPVPAILHGGEGVATQAAMSRPENRAAVDSMNRGESILGRPRESQSRTPFETKDQEWALEDTQKKVLAAIANPQASNVASEARGTSWSGQKSPSVMDTLAKMIGKTDEPPEPKKEEKKPSFSELISSIGGKISKGNFGEAFNAVKGNAGELLGGASEAISVAAPEIAAVMAVAQVVKQTAVMVRDAVVAPVSMAGNFAAGVADADANPGKVLATMGDTTRQVSDKLMFVVGPIALLGSVAGESASQLGKFMNAVSQRADQLGQYSPIIAQAQANQEVRQTMNELRRANEAGPELAQFIQMQGNLQEKFEDIKIEMLRRLLPIATAIGNGIDMLTPAGKAVGEIYDGIVMILKCVSAIPGAAALLERWLNEQNQPPVGDPTDALFRSGGLQPLGNAQPPGAPNADTL